jgi:hypothetical protein
MHAVAEMQEYLDEIRKEVCSRCVERPNGGPPCVPQGKLCGVELHLPQLVDAIHEVKSHFIAPYLDNDRKKICETCALRHSDFCPCPMDTLAVLVVEAVEAVDERRRRRAKGRELIASLPGSDRPGMEEVARAYEEATGTWTGCDWPTVFGPTRLDLQDVTGAEAEAKAVESIGPANRKAWAEAALWLREVERRAEQAEKQASLAVAAANAGEWREAVKHAQRAWALEFSTGRIMRHDPTTWHRLYEVIEASAA